MTELQALVRAAKDGDKDAFGQVVMRFQDMAYASAYATVGDACLAQDIAFDTALTHQRLYPAIDPVWSSSILLATDQVEPQHRQVAQQVRRLLRRYVDLHDAYERTGADAFWYIEDDPNLTRDIARARRVQRFFTQPFSSAEPWTGALGQHVSLTETIRGCQAILAGQYDHLPEEAFYFVGTIDQAVAKAKHR